MLKLILTGNLGKDAEIRNINSDNVVIEFSVAHTEKTKDQTGNYVGETTWVKCSKWAKPDKTAVAQYLKKGTKVCVIGVPSIAQWLNQQGENKVQFEMRVDEVELLGSAVQAQPVVNNTPPGNSVNIVKPANEDDVPF